MQNHQQESENLETDIIGKKILVGLSYYDKNGELVGQTEKYGSVLRCNTSRIIFYDELLKEEFAIPADFESLQYSDPSTIYKRKSNNKKIKGINILGSFSIRES